MMNTSGCLVLADSTTWSIEATDSLAGEIISRLIEVMKLESIDGGSGTYGENPPRRLIVSFDNHKARSALPRDTNMGSQATGPAHDRQARMGQSRRPKWAIVREEGEDVLRCNLLPFEGDSSHGIHLMMLSTLIAMRAQQSGGLLVHGALAEMDGQGAILAGPGGVGKTMASRRLPPPWRSLSDDKALIVCDAKGKFWAHALPTWGSFMFGGPGGVWDVQHAVPLRGIFYLSQNNTDRVEPIGLGEGLCLLLDSADQSLKLMSRELSLDENRALHLQRLENACAFVSEVPGYRLLISLDGDFWREIERVM